MMKKLMPLMLFLGMVAGVKAENASKGHPFYWKQVQMGDTVRKHGAVLIPLYLERDTVLVQLDLGMADHVIYEPALKKLESPFEQTLFGNVKMKGKIGDESFRATFKAKKGMPDSLVPEQNGMPVIGLIGLKLFKDKALTLDFIRERFFVNGFASFEDYHEWELPAKLVRNKLLVQLALKEASAPFWVFFDTGSSPFNLITGQEQFEHLTQGNSATDTIAIKPQHNSGDRHIRLACQKIQKPLGMGPFSMKGRPVCTDLGNRINFQSSLIGLKGVLGNQPFIGNALVHINFQKPTFQILLP